MGALTKTQKTLVQQLSPNANVYIKDSAEFSSASARWSRYKAPEFTVIVEVGTEDDVAKTIRYANEHNIPFLAYSGGHGIIKGLERVRNGIQISLKKLDSVTISEKGDTATFGGGILSKKVITTLWAAGKQTVTGCCETTSLLGPGLGGGHGFLQGKYGLISDQFVSARIVLADGTIKTISADSEEDPDLWWALQGAGHNFGIVTSITSKIYDVEKDDGFWAVESFVFSHDKAERLYERINSLWPDASHPSELVNYSVALRNPDLDPENPVIAFYILQNRRSTVETIYTEPFHDLGPIINESKSCSYPELAKHTGLDEDAPVSQKLGLNAIRFPVSIPNNYNIQAIRQLLDAFGKATNEMPGFSHSFIMFEGYSLQAVKAVPSESTAFPHREDNIIVAPVILYSNDDDNTNNNNGEVGNPAELDAKAVAFGEELWQIVWAASGQKELHAYVNYASGDEKLESLYGYEPWRLQKLAALKRKYDPEGKFGYYAPVA